VSKLRLMIFLAFSASMFVAGVWLFRQVDSFVGWQAVYLAALGFLAELSALLSLMAVMLAADGAA
jgi:hypothetical protein